MHLLRPGQRHGEGVRRGARRVAEATRLPAGPGDEDLTRATPGRVLRIRHAHAVHRVRREDIPEQVIRHAVELDYCGRIRGAHHPDRVPQAEPHRPVRHQLRDLIEHHARRHAIHVAHGGRRRRWGECRVPGGSGIEVAGIAAVGARWCRTGAGGVWVGIEVAASVRLHDFEAVNRGGVDAVILVDAVLRDLRRVHVIDQQPTAAGRRRARVEPHLAVVVNHRAVRLYLLAIFQQEVLPARVRAPNRQVERRVRRRCRAQAERAVGPERHHGHPPQLAQRPGIHTRRAEGGRVVAAAHEAPLRHAFARVVGVVQVRQPEPVTRFVRHRSHWHDLRAVASVQAAHPALEDVVRDPDALALGVNRMGRVRADPAKSVDELVAVRPEVVVRRATAGAVDGRMDEGHEIDETVAVEVVLRPIDLVVELAQRFP